MEILAKGKVPVRRRLLPLLESTVLPPAAHTIVLVGDYEWTSALTDNLGEAQFFLRPDEPLDFGLITEAGQYETGNLQASLEELAQDPEEHEELTLPSPVLLESLVIEAEHRRAALGAWE